MLVRYFEATLCLLFMLDGVQLVQLPTLDDLIYGYNGFGGRGSCNIATYTGEHCCCHIDSNKDRCCPSLPSNYCCTRTEELYRGLYCKSSQDCSGSAKPMCCSVSRKCCTRREYDIETPRCNSIADCANAARAPYCCDSKARCCTNATYTEESCSDDYDCQTTTKPHCCSLSKKCCTSREYDIETPRCNSITDCANAARAAYCCDSKARCCTNATYAEESCSSDRGCRTTTKPHCCKNSKCCTPKQYEIENPPPSEMLRRNSGALCAVALLLLAGMLSISVICLGCVYSCGAKPTKRRETPRSNESFAAVSATIELPSTQQHATPPQRPPRGNARQRNANEDGSIRYQAPAVATKPVTDLPTYNDLFPTYELATTGKVLRTAT